MVLFPKNMREFLVLGPWGLDQARRVVEFALGLAASPVTYSLSAVRLLAPVVPQVLWDCLGFDEPTKNAYAWLNLPVPPAWYELPVYDNGNSLMVVGPEADVC